MGLTELQQELENCNAMIAKVLQGGQSIQTRNGSVTLPDLNTLYAQRNNLVQQINALNGATGDTFGTPLIYQGRF